MRCKLIEIIQTDPPTIIRRNIFQKSRNVHDGRNTIRSVFDTDSQLPLFWPTMPMTSNATTYTRIQRLIHMLVTC